jgi:hypothetical protein
MIVIVIMWLCMGWTNEKLWFDSRRWQHYVLISKMSKLALRLSQPPIKWVRWFFVRRVKRSGREPYKSTESRPEVKNKWNCLHFLLCISWRTAGTNMRLYYHHHHHHHHCYLLHAGYFTYIPETNHVPREYSIADVLFLLLMVPISLVPALTLLYFYISTF